MNSVNNGGERSGPAVPGEAGCPPGCFAAGPAMTRHCSHDDWVFERERSLLDYQDELEEQREETERIADDSEL